MLQQRCCFHTEDPGLETLTSALIRFARKNLSLPRAVAVQLGVVEADPGTAPETSPCPCQLLQSSPWQVRSSLPSRAGWYPGSSTSCCWPSRPAASQLGLMGPSSWSLQYPVVNLAGPPQSGAKGAEVSRAGAFLYTKRWLHIDVPHYSPVQHQSGHCWTGEEGGEGVSPGEQIIKMNKANFTLRPEP